MSIHAKTLAVVVGGMSTIEKGVLKLAASRAGTELAFYPSVERALQTLQSLAEPPRCIFVSHKAPIASLVDAVRSNAELFGVPVIALAPYPADSEYRKAYLQGVDDVLVMSDAGGITRRLANLEGLRPGARPPASKGEAIVACEQIHQRRLLGRTLRQAGFEVCFAEGAYELIEIARAARSLTLVVVTADFPPMGAEAALRAVRSITDNPTLPAMVLPNAAKEEAPEAIISVGSEQAGKVLFFADELLSGKGKDQRASKRLLYHTICAFREPGAIEPVYGLTHNISREGLYVRTLDPPRPGSILWFEMREPGKGMGVHLRGRVMWRREPSSAGGAVPPGFGLRMETDMCPRQDLELYVQGYDELCNAVSDEANNALLEAV